MNKTFSDQLYSKLEKDKLLKKGNLESFIHSIVDIKESIDRVYKEYIPKLMSETKIESLEDVFWDIREEFRHIEYHINDADLTNISIDRESNM